MKCGIIGLPNAGKSTLFNCLTSLKAPAENYPFCTIEPNTGLVQVPDTRLKLLNKIFQPQNTKPAAIEFVDIAGLIAGAHKGEGLGNKFLSHIREATALLHVVRDFKDKNITHVQGRTNPLEDISLIETELMLADLERLEKKKEKILQLMKSGNNKKLNIEKNLVGKLILFLTKKERPVKDCPIEKEEKNLLKNFQLLTAKPYLYVLNTDEEGLIKDSPVELSLKKTKGSGAVLKINAGLESQIAGLDSQAEKEEFLQTLGLAEPGLNRLIKKSYQLLNFITFFTAGHKEVRAWTIKKGLKAPEAAGKIHSDFEKGFIKAEVYSFEDLKKWGSEKAVKEQGLYRQEGKDYLVQDGDIIFFKFNI